MPCKQDQTALHSQHPKNTRDKDAKNYHQRLKEFLQTFKVYPCNIEAVHDTQKCQYYHSFQQRRRNPYINYQFSYYIFENCSCGNDECLKMHSNYQFSYHPLLYKTCECSEYNHCQNGLLCNMLHQQDSNHFQYGQFFRFNLKTFKTEKCQKKSPHQRKTCLYYHNDKDKRRSSHFQYSHFFCQNQNCKSQNCDYSHNKLEQLYHPNRYKTKFCQNFPKDIQNCQYRDFCSFAHTISQISTNIQLIHLQDKFKRNDEFYMYKYKTVWCPFTQNHERDKCPYAHNIQDYRRSPTYFTYQSSRCSYWNFSDDIKSIQNAGCKLGMDCKKCHGWMEQRFHPCKYLSKGKASSTKKQDSETTENYIHKKLKYANKSTQNNKVNQIVNLQLKNGSKGAPFFKNDRRSQYSAKTKAKSNNIESDKSNDGSSMKEVVTKNNIQFASKPDFSFLEDYQNVWKQDQIEIQKNTSKEAKQQSSRSKSAQKSQDYQVFYSNSIKNALQDEQILKQLRNQKYNQVQIVNMTQSKINNVKNLTLAQKNLLTSKLKLYHLKNADNVNYSKQLITHFVTKKSQSILQKMQNKKVKQPYLMKLKTKQINDLSFLTQQEKQQLPKLLKTFQEEKEFNDIKKRIDNQTKIDEKEQSNASLNKYYK